MSPPLSARIRVISRPAGRERGAQKAEWDKSVIINPRLMETLGRPQEAPSVGSSSGTMQHRWDVGRGIEGEGGDHISHHVRLYSITHLLRGACTRPSTIPGGE